MNKIEKISLGTALKPSKPFVNFCFYPLLFDKYVTIDFDLSMQSLCYDHWQEVVDMIKPYLDESGIKILRVGSNKGLPIEGVYNYTDKTFNQNSYILKKSILHFNSNNFMSILCSQIGTPFVSLFAGFESSLFPFKKTSKSIFIDSPKEKSPSLSYSENPKTINSIDPIEISKSILDYLKIKHELNGIKRVFNGEMSNIKTIEVVPDFSPQPSFLANSLINLRADLHFNESNIYQFSQGRQLGLITNQPLSEGLLLSIRSSLQRISVNIDDGLDDNFLLNLKKMGLKHELFTTNESILKDLRLKYINETVEFFEKKKKPIAFPEKDCKFFLVKSSKILLSKIGSFPTKAHWVSNTKNESEFQTYIDTSDFWEDSDFLNIYEQEKDGNNNN